MRHNLSQPEEIDQILMAMAAQDLASNSPGSNRNGGPEEFTPATNISFGVVHHKTAHGLPDPQKYVRHL